MLNIIQQSFSLHIRLMCSLGLYPSTTRPKFKKVRGYLLYFILQVFVVLLVFINILCQENSDSVKANFMVMYVVEVAGLSLKVLPFFNNGQQIKKCVECIGHPQFLPQDDEERKIMEGCIQVCRRNSLTWVGLLVFAVSGWILPALLAKDYQFPLDVWLPYDPRSGPETYYATFVVLSAACIYVACCGPMLDPLIGGLAYHATTQLKILKYNVERLGKYRHKIDENRNENSKVIFEDVCELLERCVKHHNYILDYVAEYQDCFSFSVFCQVSGCTLAICFTCIGVILAPSTSFSAIKYITYFCVFSAQIFFYCFYGTLLFEENNGLIDAVYMGDWYRYDVRIRKILIMMMERSKRPMIVTAGKIVDLTLTTFTKMLKTSYSLVAVFNK